VTASLSEFHARQGHEQQALASMQGVIYLAFFDRDVFDTGRAAQTVSPACTLSFAGLILWTAAARRGLTRGDRRNQTAQPTGVGGTQCLPKTRGRGDVIDSRRFRGLPFCCKSLGSKYLVLHMCSSKAAPCLKVSQICQASVCTQGGRAGRDFVDSNDAHVSWQHLWVHTG
jgi:hypothetical protein